MGQPLERACVCELAVELGRLRLADGFRPQARGAAVVPLRMAVMPPGSQRVGQTRVRPSRPAAACGMLVYL